MGDFTSDFLRCWGRVGRRFLLNGLPNATRSEVRHVFHVAVRLFSNRSQMTSKCGNNRKVAHEAITECVTVALKKWHGILESS